jgi:hypothetical protein
MAIRVGMSTFCTNAVIISFDPVRGCFPVDPGEGGRRPFEFQVTAFEGREKAEKGREKAEKRQRGRSINTKARLSTGPNMFSLERPFDERK